MSEANKKSSKTRLLIMNSFIEIMGSKNWESITVKSIVEKAGITRGTFYLYFSDVDELITSIEEILLEELPLLKEASVANGFSKYPTLEECSPTRWELAIFDYYRKHSTWLNALLGPHGDAKFYASIKEKMQSCLIMQMQLDGAPDDYFREHFTSIIPDVFFLLAKSLTYHDNEMLAHIMSTIRIGAKYKSTIERMNDINIKKGDS